MGDMGDERPTKIRVHGGDTFDSLPLLIQAMTRKRRLIRAMALFPHDREKQKAWLLAPIDKTTIYDEWQQLEDAARAALANTYIPREDISHERWTIEQEIKDRAILAEAEGIAKPKTEPMLCEKCRAEIEANKPKEKANGQGVLWVPGMLL